MKKKMVVFYSLMFLPLAVVLIALQFLPEQIPAHYDMNNQVTRWGIKKLKMTVSLKRQTELSTHIKCAV